MKRGTDIRILIPPLLLLFPILLEAQTEPAALHQDLLEGRPRLTIPRLSHPPSLEDYLPGGSRPGIAVTDFLQREPGDLTPASEQTTAYISYDARALYVAFVCRVSEPERLRAHITKREAIFSDDNVGIFLDTYYDHQRSYEFFVNPFGMQADGIQSETADDDYTYDTQWESRGAIIADGFVTWMAIPFAVLRFPARDGKSQLWGLALMRSLPRKNENDFWPGISNQVSGFASQMAAMDGIQEIAAGHGLQFIPYATFSHARLLDRDRAERTSGSDGRAGIDAKAVIRKSLTLDFTVNPDFSQIESDEPQVTVNQRFEVQFPEKRPFFLENSDYFKTPQDLFFSRRIRDPQFGARLTGKLAGLVVGALVMDDSIHSRNADGKDLPEKRAVNTVGRLRYDFANQSRIGMLYTGREYESFSNHVLAADARIRLNSKWFFTGQVIASRSMNEIGGEYKSNKGAGLYADLSRSGRKFTYDLTYTDRSPQFRTALGFTPRVDIRQLTQFATFRIRPASGPLVAYGPNSFASVLWDHQGNLRDWTWRLPFVAELKGRTNLFGRHAFISESVAGRTFLQREDLLQFSTEYLQWLQGNATWSHGTRPNYFPADGLPPFLGTFTDVNAGLTVRPTRHFVVQETLLYNRLTARKDSPAEGEIFSSRILRSRMLYQFTKEWSIRAIVDVNHLRPNPLLANLERGRHVGFDLLLTWLSSPGTAVYVGYSDGLDNVRLVNELGASPRVETTDSRLMSTGRQVFAKLSWLFRP